MKLSNLLANIEYTVINDGNPEITDIIYDSRKVTDGTAFVCLKGYTSDGHMYAQSAVEKGAAAIIISDDLSFDVPKNVAVIKVENTRKALAYISAEFFGRPAEKLKTIAITGTKGKTTTTAMIASILECAGIKTGTIGTLGILYDGKVVKTDNTTPESYEIQKAMHDMLECGCKAMVIEASSIGLKHYRLADITFDVGIFTNFSHDHIGGVEHKDMAEYLYCKSLLFGQCRHSAGNIDDEKFSEITKLSVEKPVTFGFSNKADFVASDEHLLFENGFIGVHFELSGRTDKTFA